jgi:hypothetical protein
MRFGDRLRSAFWKQRVEDEVDSEFDFHVEMRTREYVARGMSARTRAKRRFGVSATSIASTTRAVASADCETGT